MRNLRPLQSALQWLVGGLVIVLLVRTWVVLGLVQPVQVAGNSMAPALLGEHYSVACPQCQSLLVFAADLKPSAPSAACPHCGNPSVPLENAPLHVGDSLMVDRFSESLGPLVRGDLVVVRSPDDSRQLCVKRILGLPGESVALRWGDVWIDGRPATKSLAEQRALRLLLHKETSTNRRWQMAPEATWLWNNRHWQIDCRATEKTYWLQYQHPQRRPLTDEYNYNVGLTRQLNPVRDIMLVANISVLGEGRLLLEFGQEIPTCRVAIEPSTKKVSLHVGDAFAADRCLTRILSDRLSGDGVLVELSNFDGKILLAMDGEVLLNVPHVPESAPTASSQPVSIGATDLRVSLQNLSLYRDIYYCSQAVGLAPMPENVVHRLSLGHYYLLGDNSPISVDSRSWGPVAQGLIVGRPLAPGFRGRD